MRRNLETKQGQIEELTARLTACRNQEWPASEPVYDYDPPV